MNYTGLFVNLFRASPMQLNGACHNFVANSVVQFKRTRKDNLNITFSGLAGDVIKQNFCVALHHIFGQLVLPPPLETCRNRHFPGNLHAVGEIIECQNERRRSRVVGHLQDMVVRSGVRVRLGIADSLQELPKSRGDVVYGLPGQFLELHRRRSRTQKRRVARRGQGHAIRVRHW